MTPGRFAGVDIPACIIWTPAYLLPGMLFGASLELATEYAGRLTLVLVILAVTLWLTWWLIWVIYGFLVKRSAQWLGRAIRWSRRHPVLGRLAGPLLDPSQPEMLSVSMLGVLLVITFWTLALLLFLYPFSAQPEAVDQYVLAQAQALRNHVADPFMVAIMQMSRWWVLLPAPAAVLLWLLGAGRTSAAIHWLVAIGGGVLLQLTLGWTLRATPLLHSAGIDLFYIPSAALTLSTVVLGFFSVMVARELRQQYRKWPYLATALVLALLLMARVYLGLDWLSGSLAGILLGFTWTAIVGIAYRQRALQPFSGAVVSAIFFGTLAITMAWQVEQRLKQDLGALRPTLPAASMVEEAWWNGGWSLLPRERTRFKSVAARSFNVQLAIPLPDLERAMQAKGWEAIPGANWKWLIQALNPKPNCPSGTGGTRVLKPDSPPPPVTCACPSMKPGIRRRPSRLNSVAGATDSSAFLPLMAIILPPPISILRRPRSSGVKTWALVRSFNKGGVQHQKWGVILHYRATTQQMICRRR